MLNPDEVVVEVVRLGQQVIDNDKLFQQRWDAQQSAIAKADIANERRFDSVNEFRQTLTDQTASFITRVEHDALLGRLSDLSDRINRMEGGKTDFGAALGWAIAVVAIIVAAVIHFI